MKPLTEQQVQELAKECVPGGFPENTLVKPSQHHWMTGFVRGYLLCQSQFEAPRAPGLPAKKIPNKLAKPWAALGISERSYYRQKRKAKGLNVRGS